MILTGRIKVAVLIGTHAAALLVGYGLRDRDYQAHLKKDASRAAQAEKDIATINTATATLALKVRDAGEAKQEKIRETTRETVKAIPLYLPASGWVPSDDERGGAQAGGQVGTQTQASQVVSGGSLSVGFGRLYDYAILGVTPPVPPASGEPLAGASGVTLPALAETHASNSGVCLSYLEEVRRWRTWYQGEAALWSKGMSTSTTKVKKLRREGAGLTQR